MTKAKITVAIAEDNTADMAALKQEVANNPKLKLQLTAVNGYDLLLQFQKLQKDKLPQILLLDINMPIINGLLVTMYCKFIYPSIKIIGVSSHTNNRLVTEVLTEGAVGFITKYFLAKTSILYNAHYNNTDLLDEAITAALKNKQYIDILLVNEPNKIQLSLTTQAIIAKHYSYLQPKHIEFLMLNTSCLDMKKIASLICISIGTAKDYRTFLCKKFNAADRFQLSRICMEVGVVKLALYYDNTMAA